MGDSRRITLLPPARVPARHAVPIPAPHTNAFASAWPWLPLPRRNPSQRPLYRFQVGDQCYVRHRPLDETFTVVNRFTHDTGLPHYVVRDVAGIELRVSQLQISSKPIKLKK